MRKIDVLTFLTMDGVMQAPGGPEEDTSGGFSRGGWTVGYFDDAVGQEMAKQMGAQVRPACSAPDIRDLHGLLAAGRRSPAPT